MFTPGVGGHVPGGRRHRRHPGRAGRRAGGRGAAGPLRRRADGRRRSSSTSSRRTSRSSARRTTSSSSSSRRWCATSTSSSRSSACPSSASPTGSRCPRATSTSRPRSARARPRAPAGPAGRVRTWPRSGAEAVLATARAVLAEEPEVAVDYLDAARPRPRPGAAVDGTGPAARGRARRRHAADRQRRGEALVLLCVDVGNTEIALGLYAEGDEDEVRPPLVRDWRMHTEPRMTADELEVAIGGMLGRRYVGGGHRRVGAVDGARACCASCGCSSSDGTSRRWSSGRACARGCRCWWTTRARSAPTASSTPWRRTGSSTRRAWWSTSARRRTSTSSPRKGEFLGGVLAPGIEISMEALATRAAALRTVELVAPRSVIGKNTVECLQAGRALRLRRAGRRAGRAASSTSSGRGARSP